MNHKGTDRVMQGMQIGLNFLVVLCLMTALFAAFVPLGNVEEMRGDYTVPGLGAQLMMAAVPVGFWLIRLYARVFWQFAGLHAAVMAAAVILTGRTTAQRIAFGAVAAGYLFVSFHVRLSEKTEDPFSGKAEETGGEGETGPVPAGLAAAGAYALCSYLGADEACSRIVNIALIYTFFFFLYTYLGQLQRFVRFNRSSNSHIPVERMLLQGGGLTAACSLSAVLLLGAGAGGSVVAGLGAALKEAALWAARIVLGLISRILGLFEGGGEETVQEAAGATAPMMGMAEAEPTPLWLDILLRAVEYLILAAAVGAVAYCLYKLAEEMLRRFYMKRGEKEEWNGQALETRERLQKTRVTYKEKMRIPFLARTPEEKIRRSFIRAVYRTGRYRNPEGKTERTRAGRQQAEEARAALLEGKTARELGMLWDGEADNVREAVGKLTELYEKARYEGGCDGSDALRAEQYRKNAAR